MIAVHILEHHDVIQETDYVRQLSLVFDGQSDSLITTNPYSGHRINRLGWILASEECPYWVGRTVGEYNDGMQFDGRHDSELCRYEFIRGEIPDSHLEPKDYDYGQ